MSAGEDQNIVYCENEREAEREVLTLVGKYTVWKEVRKNSKEIIRNAAQRLEREHDFICQWGSVFRAGSVLGRLVNLFDPNFSFVGGTALDCISFVLQKRVEAVIKKTAAGVKDAIKKDNAATQELYSAVVETIGTHYDNRNFHSLTEKRRVESTSILRRIVNYAAKSIESGILTFALGTSGPLADVMLMCLGSLALAKDIDGMFRNICRHGTYIALAEKCMEINQVLLVREKNIDEAVKELNVIQSMEM